MKKSKQKLNSLSNAALKSALATHLFLVILFAVYTILSRAWHVITPDANVWRWTALSGLVTVVFAEIFMIKSRVWSAKAYENFIKVLIVTDIAFASFNIFSQRGMASRAVALYAIPIILAACLLRAKYIFATAVMSALAYIFSAWWYFHTHFNEGYRAELFFEVGFYSFSFLILASMLWSLVRSARRVQS